MYAVQYIPSCFIAPEVLDPKAKFRPADLLPWALTRIPRGPSPLAQSTVQTYAMVQEEQNNTCLTRAGSTHRQGLIFYFYHHYLYCHPVVVVVVVVIFLRMF